MNKFLAVMIIAALASSAQAIYIENPSPPLSPNVAEVFNPMNSTTTDGGALRVAHKFVKLYDSGSIGSGAVISTGAINLQGVSELEVIAYNASADTFRDLRLDTYADDGVAILGTTTTLRSVPYAVSGAGYNTAAQPNLMRVYVGPSPAAGSEVITTLYDSTSADNGTLVAAVFGEGFRAITAKASGSGGTFQTTAWENLDDGTARQVSGNGTTQYHTICWGLGCALTSPAFQTHISLPYPPARRVRISTTGPGAGNTARLIVQGIGAPPGFASVQMSIPHYLGFSLASGGTAVGRMVIYGR